MSKTMNSHTLPVTVAPMLERAMPAQYERPFSEIQVLPGTPDVAVASEEAAAYLFNSVSALFHSQIADESIFQAFEVMRWCNSLSGCSLDLTREKRSICPDFELFGKLGSDIFKLIGKMSGNVILFFLSSQAYYGCGISSFFSGVSGGHMLYGLPGHFREQRQRNQIALY